MKLFTETKVLAVLGLVVIAHVILGLLLLNNIRARLTDHQSPVQDSEARAYDAAQFFLRQVAAKRYERACTQVVLPGPLNECMDDLTTRDLHEVHEAGVRLRVIHIEFSSSTATLTGRDIRPTLSDDFHLGLKRVQGGWLVTSINGDDITGSP